MSETTDENGASPAEDLAAPHTPDYNTEDDAARYPDVIPSPIPAHTVFKGNPEIDGPYLDDVREAQADARRKADDAVSEIQRKRAEEGQQLLENLREANAKVIDITTGGEVTDEGLSPDDETVVGEEGGPTGNNDGELVDENENE